MKSKCVTILMIFLLVATAFLVVPATNAQPVHDVLIINVATDLPHTYPGFAVNITVEVKNNGEVLEPEFNITVSRNETIIDIITIGNVTVYNLDIGESRNVSLLWDTKGMEPCHNWTISAKAWLEGDSNPDDNTLFDGAVKITIFADVDGDGSVGILDITKAAAAYRATPKDILLWDPLADVAPEYGVIDILDLITLVFYYGNKCP